MKKDQITIGGVYRAKVSDKLTDVRIDKEHPAGGWSAINLATGKLVRIKSAQRMRGPSNAESASPKNATPANTGKRTPKATTPAKSVAKRDTAQPRGQGANVKKSAPASKTTAAKRPGCLDVAAQVLAEHADGPMTCKAIIEVMFARQLWSTNGATPEATLYAAIIREISKKGKESRFEKVDRGRFQLRAAAGKKGA